MLKNSAEQYSKPDSSRVPVAKSTQDTIEIEAIAADGIFYLGNNLWSKTYRFSDVNYAMLSEDEQIEFIYAYLKALSSLSVRFKISVMNRAKDEQLFRKQALLQLHNDGYDYLKKKKSMKSSINYNSPTDKDYKESDLLDTINKDY